MTLMARDWWAVLIRGIAAVLFGILALFWPQLTLQVLVLLFGAYALVDGIFALIAAFQAASRRRGFDWRSVGWPIVEGLAGIIAGVLTFSWPGVTALVLLYFIGAWAIVTGIAEIVQPIALRRVIQNEWLLILGGVLPIVFGSLLFVFPGAGALAIVWLIGSYAIVFGILLIGLNLRLRSMRARRDHDASILESSGTRTCAARYARFSQRKRSVQPPGAVIHGCPRLISPRPDPLTHH